MKKTLSVLLSAAMVISLAACGGSQPAATTAAPAAPAATQAAAPAAAPAETKAEAPAETKAEEAAASEELALKDFTRLTMSSASIGGALYTWGAAFGSTINEHVKNLELTNEASNGPAANLGLVSSGQTDLGCVTDSVCYEGYTGTGDYEGKPYPNIRGMFVSYPSGLQIFTIKGSGIEKIEDLDGARIGFGPSGSSGDLIGHRILDVLGIKAGSETFLGWTDTIDNLKDGLIDVCVDVGGYPHSSRQELEATNEVVYLELSAEQLAAVAEAYPYYKQGTIPQDTYKYLTEDYDTVLIWYDVICQDTMDEELVYTLTKAAFAIVPDLVEINSVSKYMDPNNLPFCSIPLHKGAARYYEEMGIEIPDAIKPID